MNSSLENGQLLPRPRAALTLVGVVEGGVFSGQGQGGIVVNFGKQL